MEPLQGNEAFQQLLKLLNENGKTIQAQDLSLMVWYLDGMERQFDTVLRELQEVKAQLAQERQPVIKAIMQGSVTNLENKVQWARDSLSALRERIMDCAKNALKNFKDAGVSALDNAVAAMGVKKGLENLQEGLQNALSSMQETLGKAEEMGTQLRRGFRNIANAGRIATNKELDFDPKIEEGRFQSVILAPLRGAQKLLSNINNNTLAAIGAVEDLEQTADKARDRQAERAAGKPGKRLAKKPSIRQALKENQDKIAAAAAPAPDKEKKQEAVL